MRKGLLFVILLMLIGILSGQEFQRNFPKKELLNQLTKENFPNYDAFIVLKEQSYNLHETVYFYHGYPYHGYGKTKTVVKIIKLFTEKAVTKYGTFEFSYNEPQIDEFKCNFDIKIRNLKVNGEIWVMPEEDLKIMVTRETSQGRAISRKAIVKIPNLAAGDVLQIEYNFFKPFTINSSGFFFYNESDPILYSNLYITLPEGVEFEYKSFPANQVGPPKILNLSDDEDIKTYFWSVKKLYNIPDEAYSAPFEDQSLMTTFVIKQWPDQDEPSGTWDKIAENFSDFLENDHEDLDDENILSLGFSENRIDSTITFSTVDSLYTSIRKNLVLTSSNAIHPLSKDINKIFEDKEGDASDMSYIMARILEKWGIYSQFVLIRDLRQGIIEQSVPSTAWFDRSAVNVHIKGNQKLYDFDRSISCYYKEPWYLMGTSFFVINGKHGMFVKDKHFPKITENSILEYHNARLDSADQIYDQSAVVYKGYFAENLRNAAYYLDESDVKSMAEKMIGNRCLEKCDSIWVNKFEENPELKIKAQGPSKIKVESIDQMKVFHPEIVSLYNIKDKLYTEHRFNDIYFKVPFRISVIYNITWPDSLVLVNEMQSKVIKGPSMSKSQINYYKKKNGLTVRLETQFPKSFIEVNSFKFLLDFLDNSMNKIHSDIALKKKA